MVYISDKRGVCYFASYESEGKAMPILCKRFVKKIIGFEPNTLKISVRIKNPKKADFVQIRYGGGDYAHVSALKESFPMYLGLRDFIRQYINREYFWIKIEPK